MAENHPDKEFVGIDFMPEHVAHGWAWVAPAVREALFKLAGSLPKPGGLIYDIYNTYPGWLPASRFQHLVMQLQQR